jgi:hypothetical protein
VDLRNDSSDMDYPLWLPVQTVWGCTVDHLHHPEPDMDYPLWLPVQTVWRCTVDLRNASPHPRTACPQPSSPALPSCSGGTVEYTHPSLSDSRRIYMAHLTGSDQSIKLAPGGPWYLRTPPCQIPAGNTWHIIIIIGYTGQA